MTDLVQFCKEHGTPKLRAAAVPALSLYLAWALQRQAVGVVEDETGIVAVGIAWPVRDDGRQMEDPTWNAIRAAVPESPLVYVANMASPDPDARRRLIEWAANRYPFAQEFCGHRERTSGNTFVRYPLRTAARFYQA